MKNGRIPCLGVHYIVIHKATFEKTDEVSQEWLVPTDYDVVPLGEPVEYGDWVVSRLLVAQFP